MQHTTSSNIFSVLFLLTFLAYLIGIASVPVKRKSAFERLGNEHSSNVSKNLECVSPAVKIAKLTKSPTTKPQSKIISLAKVGWCSQMWS